MPLPEARARYGLIKRSESALPALVTLAGTVEDAAGIMLEKATSWKEEPEVGLSKSPSLPKLRERRPRHAGDLDGWLARFSQLAGNMRSDWAPPAKAALGIRLRSDACGPPGLPALAPFHPHGGGGRPQRSSSRQGRGRSRGRSRPTSRDFASRPGSREWGALGEAPGGGYESRPGSRSAGTSALNTARPGTGESSLSTSSAVRPSAARDYDLSDPLSYHAGEVGRSQFFRIARAIRERPGDAQIVNDWLDEDTHAAGGDTAASRVEGAAARGFLASLIEHGLAPRPTLARIDVASKHLKVAGFGLGDAFGVALTKALPQLPGLDRRVRERVIRFHFNMKKETTVF